MKTIQVNNFKNFLRKAAVRYNTTVQQVADVADELGCTILCQQRKMYSKDYTYMLISQEDVYKVLNELEARKDNLAQRTEARKRKRTCKEDKLEWLRDQGAQVDATDKPNIYTVSMYNGAIVKHFNINCSMTNIQDYFDRCFCKHKDEDYDKQGKLILKSDRDMLVTSKTKVNQKKVISIGSMNENGVHTIEADLTADEFLEYADKCIAEDEVIADEVEDEKEDPAELRDMFRTLEV